MKNHELPHDQALQNDIEEQELAMSQMLSRVMERPLLPLHKTIEELGAQITAARKDSAHGVLAVEAGLIDALEKQSKRLNSQFSSVMTDAESLKGALAGLGTSLEKRATAQGESIALMQQELARVGAVLAQQKSQEDDRFSSTTAFLDRLDARTMVTSDHLAVATGAIQTLDTNLAALGEQERGSVGRLSDKLTLMTQQVDRQQVVTRERIDALEASMTPHFAVLASTIDASSHEIAARYHTVADSQKAFLAAAIEEQLSTRLAPLRARSAALLALCAMSFASTLTLLGLHFYH